MSECIQEMQIRPGVCVNGKEMKNYIITKQLSILSYRIALCRINTFSGKTTWSKLFLLPSKKGSTLKDKNLLPNKNICNGYSLEVPCQGASNDYPQLMFLFGSKFFPFRGGPFFRKG